MAALATSAVPQGAELVRRLVCAGLVDGVHEADLASLFRNRMDAIRRALRTIAQEVRHTATRSLLTQIRWIPLSRAWIRGGGCSTGSRS